MIRRTFDLTTFNVKDNKIRDYGTQSISNGTVAVIPLDTAELAASLTLPDGTKVPPTFVAINQSSGNDTGGSNATGPAGSGNGTGPVVMSGTGTSVGLTGSSGWATNSSANNNPVNNNQIGDAAEINIDQPISQSINPAGSENFYRFPVNTSGILKLRLDAVPKDMRPELSLYDSNLNGIPNALSSASNPGDTVSLTKDVQGPGWICIMVRDSEGKAHIEPYTLKITFQPTPDRYEPNPNFFRASEVTLGQIITAYICPSGNEDFYKFHIDTAGIFKLKLDAVPKDMRAELSLYDKDFNGISNALSSASNPGDTVSLTKDVQGPGWIYIKVRDPEGKAHGEPYTLKIAFEPAPDQFEPNPNFFRAAEITPGQSITAYICPSGDEDFYKFQVGSDGMAKFKLEKVPKDMKAELSLYDKNFNGVSNALSSASNPGDMVSLEEDVKGPAWFYLKVRDPTGKAFSEPYTLMFSL